MHEMSLLESIIDLIEEEHRKAAFSRVRTIRIRVGALSMATPDALRFCFPIIARGTIADGARLDIDPVPGAAWCEACGRSVTLADRYGACPDCGNASLRMTAGNELQLTDIEVE